MEHGSIWCSVQCKHDDNLPLSEKSLVRDSDTWSSWFLGVLNCCCSQVTPKGVELGNQDHDVWDAHTVNHASVRMFTEGDFKTAFEMAQVSLDKWRLVLRDMVCVVFFCFCNELINIAFCCRQWNYRDISSSYPDTPEQTRPFANGHYTTHV